MESNSKIKSCRRYVHGTTGICSRNKPTHSQNYLHNERDHKTNRNEPNDPSAIYISESFQQNYRSLCIMSVNPIRNQLSTSSNKQAVTLLFETLQNIDSVIGTNNKDDECSVFMKKHNLELTESEYIVIKLWSLSSELTKIYHIDCSNNKSFEWKLFIKAMTSGIIKIYVAMMINTFKDNTKRVFPSIPIQLFRGTKIFHPNCKKWEIGSILSFTSSLSTANRFGKSSNFDSTNLNGQKQQNQICILNIINAKQHISKQQLIAAPIQWISMYQAEEEWIVLPSLYTFKVEKNNETQIIGGNMYNLLLMPIV